MGLLIGILEAIAAVASPLASLFKSAFTVWNDEAHGATAEQLSTDAQAFAQSAANTATNVHDQITMVHNQLAANYPAMSVTHAHALAAIAVAGVQSPSKPS